MAFRASTGLRNKILSLQAFLAAFLSGTTLTYVDGGASEDSITDSGSGFISAGFAPGQKIYTKNSTTGANDFSGVALTGVTAGTITFATGTVNTGEAFEADTCVLAAEGGSLKDIFRDGILYLYSGSQPSSADDAPNGSLLLKVTLSSGAWVAGAFDNGLEFGDAASGVVGIAAGAVWSGVGESAAGTGTTAASFRLCANPTDGGGSSTTLPRLDGTVALSGGDLNLTDTTIVSGRTHTIDGFDVTFPAQYGS